MIYQQNNPAAVTFYQYGFFTGAAIVGKDVSQLSVKIAKDGDLGTKVLSLVESGATGDQRNAREIGDGIYEFDGLAEDFDTLGRLRVTVVDSTGVAIDDVAEHLVTRGSLDNLDAAVSSAVELITRNLGLAQENYYLDNTVYDESGRLTNARVRIYDSASNVGTGDGILSTYTIVATYDISGLLTYGVTKS